MCKDCNRLHEELQIQSHHMYLLRKELSTLEKKLSRERHDKKKLVKEKKKDMKLRYRSRDRKSKHKQFYGYN